MSDDWSGLITGLWLPDPAGAVRANPRYATPFAKQRFWSGTVITGISRRG